MNLEGIRQHLTYANAMATIAVFVVLGGGAYAATKLPKNSVGAKQIKKNAVTTAKIKSGAVTSAKVKKGSLLASSFKAGQLPQGATGPAGAKGATGSAGTTGPQGATGQPGLSVAAAGGGRDPKSLIGSTNQYTLASTPITVTRLSNLVVWGSMQDSLVICAVTGCDGPGPSDSTNIGIYLDGDPDLTLPAPVPHSGVNVLGGGLNEIFVPSVSGVLEDVDPGTYEVKLILSSFGISTGTNDSAGAKPWVTAIATG